jgi:hypothetical protein
MLYHINPNKGGEGVKEWDGLGEEANETCILWKEGRVNSLSCID